MRPRVHTSDAAPSAGPPSGSVPGPHPQELVLDGRAIHPSARVPGRRRAGALEAGGLLIAAFLAAVLLSAALLFWLEPMFARMLLPMLGGSPSVWNTALVFYQLALLAGYGYVHWTSRLAPRRQAALHLVLMAAAWATLPIAIPRGWQPPAEGNPIPWLLGLLTVAVGLPFVVVSTTGPLMQRWFSASDHPWARDPYFLYAASNAGSMAGLLAYPLLLEPKLRLADQTRLWSAGYLLLLGVIVLCSWPLWRGRRAGPEAAGRPTAERAAPISTKRRLRWLLLAFAPSSLMMGVTTHITTDVAAVPLLWVVPLALYLTSFIVAFARRQPVPQRLWARLLPMMIVALLIVMVGRAGHPLVAILGLHCAALFVGAMVCHGELARDRPGPERLTEFYLWLALGGALGGVFNALVAPLVFDSVVEYPLALVLVCLLAPPRIQGGSTRTARILDVALPAALAGVCLLTLALCRASGIQTTRLLVVLLTSVLAFPLYSFTRRPVRFGLGVAALLIANPIEVAQGTKLLHAERSFFGIHRVLLDPRGLNALYHGTTLHGVQRVTPTAGCREPLGYYGSSGPLGDAFASLGATGRLRSIGVCGLGTGGIAAYAQAGQSWTFYEIDPAVRGIASDPKWFCFLSGAPTTPRVVLGDARLSIARGADRFDLLILDAYTSDAIPVHLLTREALEVYRSHLSDHGTMLFHISNQYFDLAPVVARLASDAGYRCWIRRAGPSRPEDLKNGLVPSTWAIIARDPPDLGVLGSRPGWKEIHPEVGLPLWTDDYSSLFSVLRRS